jgi:hypothetical protein
LFNKCKKIPLVQVYYNQDFGFLIVPNAVEKNMWCHVSIEPTERVMPDSSPDELGNSIIRVMKIAKKAPKVIKEEIELSKYWKQNIRVLQLFLNIFNQYTFVKSVIN